jgi:hypothetical protein
MDFLERHTAFQETGEIGLNLAFELRQSNPLLLRQGGNGLTSLFSSQLEHGERTIANQTAIPSICPNVCSKLFPMHHELLIEFCSGWACDNGMAAISVHAGEVVDQEELLELSAGAKTLFNLTTLVCRGYDRILDCHRLWIETLGTFQKALAAWVDMPADHDPPLRFYLMQLERFCELAFTTFRRPKGRHLSGGTNPISAQRSAPLSSMASSSVVGFHFPGAGPVDVRGRDDLEQQLLSAWLFYSPFASHR